MTERLKLYKSNIEGVYDVCWITIGGRQYFISGLGGDKQSIIEVDNVVGDGMAVVVNGLVIME